MVIEFFKNGRSVSGTALVTKGNGGNILSSKLSSDLGLVIVANSNTQDDINGAGSMAQQNRKNHPSPVGEIECITDVKIPLRNNLEAKQVANQHSRGLIRSQAAVGKEAKVFENLDITERVDGPTGWISPTLAPTKTRIMT